MHPFWLSHEEKRDCVRLSVGGGRGRSWSSMAGHGELAGEGKEGEEGGGVGGRYWEGSLGRGRVAGGAPGLQPCCYCC
jgi:hypothetical protein